jgi:single-strand DNA-binding protein
MNNNFNQFPPQNFGFQGAPQYGGFPGGQGQPQFQGQDQNNVNKAAFSNHAKIQVIAYLTSDPKSDVIGQSKVATSSIAINHKGSKQGDEPDFWNIEVWVNQGQSSATHDFLVDYCKKGRQVFIEGIPYLKKTEAKDPQTKQPILNSQGKPVYTYYPTIRVQTLIALGGGNSNQENGGNQNQQFQQSAQQPQQQGPLNGQPGFPAQGPGFGGFPQGNFGQQPAAPMGGFGAPQFAGAGAR